MGRKVATPRGQEAPGSKDADETSVISLTVPRELGWRLGVLSRMREVPMGQMCEAALWTVVEGEPLPWERHRREAEARRAAALKAASQAAGARDSGTTLPIGEAVTPSPSEDGTSAAGAGEDPAPAAPRVAARRKPA